MKIRHGLPREMRPIVHPRASRWWRREILSNGICRLIYRVDITKRNKRGLVPYS